MFIREQNQSRPVYNYKVFTDIAGAEEWDPVIHHIDSSFAIHIIIFEHGLTAPRLVKCRSINYY